MFISSSLIPAATAGSTAAVEVQGNGLVVHNAGQLVGRPLIPMAPLTIESPDGIGSSPVLRLLPQSMMIGTATIDGSVTTSQPVMIAGAKEYIIRSVIFADATVATPLAAAGLFNLSSSGTAILPTTTPLAGLDPADAQRIVQVSPSYSYKLSAPVLWIRMGTTFVGSFNVYIIGDVLTTHDR